jgi:formylglycine-generating enzyme required for sulfatase activity
MSGNVWEWVWDWFGDYSTEMSTNVSVENQLDSAENNLDSVENPTGNPTGSYRVRRGGSWYDSPEVVRASYRSSNDPTYQSDDLGFRICRFP